MRAICTLLLVATLASVFTGVAGATAQSAREPERGCEVCHGAEAKLFARGVHARAGAHCTDCHGGNPDTNDQERAHADLRALQDPLASIESCATCHADPEEMHGYGLSTEQLSLYWTSAHGAALRERGDADVATCVDCHGSHGVLAHTDPRSPVHPLRQLETCGTCHADEARMAPHGLDAGVVEAYRGSVHGVALYERGVLSSPSCTDCHGSHGALPPRVDELGLVCGSCHSLVREAFELSPHMGPVREGLLDECTACHDDHAVREPTAEMLVGDGPGHCGRCHQGEDDPGATVGRTLFASLSDLDAGIDEGEDRLRQAAARGLFLGVERDYLADARELRGRARTLTHTLSERRLDDLLNRGRAMLEQTYESVDIRERELRDRRIFTGIFLGVTLLLAAVLLIYRHETFGRSAKPAMPRGEPAGDTSRG